MCLASVYSVNAAKEKKLVCKNVASISAKDNKLIFTNLMGIPTVIDGTLETVNLMDNYIYVREREQ